MLKPFAAAASLVVLSACAAPTPAPMRTAEMVSAEPRRDCFRAGQVNGFSAESDRVVHVSVGANDHYRLDLLGACPDVDWSNRIGIQSRGSSWICSGLDATLIVPSAIGPQTCPVSRVTKLTEAEAAARR